MIETKKQPVSETRLLKPSFFIVGAPKCGTTALASYLSQHPDVFFCEPKEPNYFNRDVVKAGPIDTLEKYHALFENAQVHHRLAGEGSVWYLYSNEAATRIRQYNPEARLILMFRDPVELVYSLYYQFVTNGSENATDFETAWRWQEDRLQGKRLPVFKNVPLTQYRRIGRLGEQLQRVLNIFPRSQVHWIFYEDFARHTEREYSQVCDFLGIQDIKPQVFEKVNANKRIRHPAAQRLLWLVGHNALARNLTGVVKRTTGIQRLNILPRLRSWNMVVNQPRPPLSTELRQEILESFREDIAHLSDLTGRKLDHWLT